MYPLMRQLWQDDGGAVIAIEFMLFAVIVLFGLIVGFVGLRNAVVAEMTAVADAVNGLSICFSFSGLSNCESSVCGSQVIPIEGPPIQANKTPATDISFITVNPCGDGNEDHHHKHHHDGDPCN